MSWTLSPRESIFVMSTCMATSTALVTPAVAIGRTAAAAGPGSQSIGTVATHWVAEQTPAAETSPIRTLTLLTSVASANATVTVSGAVGTKTKGNRAMPAAGSKVTVRLSACAMDIDSGTCLCGSYEV